MTETAINPGSNLSLIFGSSFDAAAYADSSLFLYQSNGVDDIEVEVVPEPGTWAMLVGGLAVLVVWQRRRKQV